MEEMRKVNFLAPAEIYATAANAGAKKAELSLWKLIILGLLAGVYIGFGANLATVVANDAPRYLGNGIAQFIFGSTFAVGLMLVVIGGAELFTGNNMFMTVSCLDGKVSVKGLLRNWVVVWIANFIGALLLVGIVYYGGTWALFQSGVGAKALAIANAKVNLTWSQVFFRGILCNWLVCLAVWLALAGKDVVSKVVGIYFPVMAFVASGFEHSVANMFFVPMGILLAGVPDVVSAAQATQAVTSIAGLTWPHFIAANLIPATLGNVVGGAFFVGTFYAWAYQSKHTPAVKVTKKIA